MSDKFSFYQTEGLWGIIENASDEKQTSIKSYFGSDLIIKRLNEQAEQIDQLKQQLAEKEQEFFVFKEDSSRNEQIYVRELAEKDKEIERLKERLSVFDNFKDNYGYTNYDDSEILEDLQSRAFQGEDDTAVIESLFEFFDICDENEILPKVEEISEKLKCAIVPRFKKGDTAYAIMDTTLYTDVFKVNILDTELCYKVDRGDNDISTQHYTRLFSNEQEAQAKLQELRGGE